jgi:hypothetical protein|nr:MAG TPA: Protein of unknown function (DUF2570) [Caudoviricetes sp.]
MEISTIKSVKDLIPLWGKALSAIVIIGLIALLIYQYGENSYQRGKIDAEAMYLKTSVDLSNRIRNVEGTVLTQFRENRKGIQDILKDNNAEIRAMIVDQECVSKDFKDEYNKRLKK